MKTVFQVWVHSGNFNTNLAEVKWLILTNSHRISSHQYAAWTTRFTNPQGPLDTRMSRRGFSLPSEDRGSVNGRWGWPTSSCSKSRVALFHSNSLAKSYILGIFTSYVQPKGIQKRLEEFSGEKHLFLLPVLQSLKRLCCLWNPLSLEKRGPGRYQTSSLSSLECYTGSSEWRGRVV